MSNLQSDTRQMRQFIFEQADLSCVRRVLDLGCGRGGDLRELARLIVPEARLVGLDAMPKAIEAAREGAGDDPRFDFRVADVTQGLPFPADSFDLVLSVNLLECITDKDALLREVHRVLAPDGQVVFAHYDWDSQLFDGTDKALVRKVVHTFNDWQQAWMTDCDAWMGRRLWRAFQHTGLFTGAVYPYVLTETKFTEEHFGYRRVQDFHALVRRGMIRQEEYDAFVTDIDTLAERDEYFYSITMYMYVGRKV